MLILRARRPEGVVIGRLGTLALRPGFYAYVGSALGPGGLGARLAHHRGPVARPHWHIDYLRPVTQLEELWYTTEPARREHDWAALLQTLPTASIPLRRFGASDCRCESHLVRFERRPVLETFRRRVRRCAGPRTLVQGARPRRRCGLAAGV